MLKILRRIRFKNNWALFTALLLYSWILIHYIDVVTTYHRPDDVRLVEILFYVTSFCFLFIVGTNIELLPKGSESSFRFASFRFASVIKKINFKVATLIILTGVFVFYGIKHIGLLPSSLLYSLISYPLIGEKRILYILGVTLIFLVFIFFLFQFWLRIPLPWGIFYDFVRQYGVY